MFLLEKKFTENSRAHKFENKYKNGVMINKFREYNNKTKQKSILN